MNRRDGLRPLVVDVARSEWTKLQSVRSTYWTLFVAVVGMVGFGALLCAAYVRHYTSEATTSTFDPAGYSLSGFFLAQLAVGTLGVVVVTSEYQTGSIRATLAGTPQRTVVLVAKAAVFAAVAAGIAVISSLTSFLVGQMILAQKHLGIGLAGPGATRSVIGAAFYDSVLGLFGLGLGALIRRTAGAMAALVGVVLVLPVVVQGLPGSWQNAVTRYLPSVAGQAVIGHTKFTPAGQQLHPWTGLGLFCAYTAAVLIAAGVVLTRQDA